MLENGYVVEGIGSVALGQTFHAYLQQVALLKRVVTTMYAGYGIGNAVSGDIGQESQAAGVDSNHGDALAAYAGSGTQECAVASYADDCIGRKVSAVKEGVIGNIQAHLAGQKLVVGAVHGNLVTECAQKAEELLLLAAELVT